MDAKRQADEFWMKTALELGKKAAEKDEVPVGAVLIDSQGQKISQGFNLRESLNTSLGHAEILALHRASKLKKSWRLLETTLYVTLEPCLMCAGALIQSRVSRVVFGAYDPKGGAFGSLYNVAQDKRLNHQIEVVGGFMEAECGQLLKDFFKAKRNSSKKN
jgi:tRNA(adenine34) deaminase